MTLGALERPEGAAGSIYQRVPVSVQFTDAAGQRQHWRGTYTLRRVNDVEGASAEQRRWHIAGVEAGAQP